jgi:hypothetical protein
VVSPDGRCAAADAQSGPELNRADVRKDSPMAKGQQRSNKEAKKPKKDAAGVKPLSPVTVMPTITTTIIERGKKKSK